MFSYFKHFDTLNILIGQKMRKLCFFWGKNFDENHKIDIKTQDVPLGFSYFQDIIFRAIQTKVV